METIKTYKFEGLQKAGTRFLVIIILLIIIAIILGAKEIEFSKLSTFTILVICFLTDVKFKINEVSLN